MVYCTVESTSFYNLLLINVVRPMTNLNASGLWEPLIILLDQASATESCYLYFNYQFSSPAGNRTPVSRVTGGDTYHYTTEDCDDYREINFKLCMRTENLFFFKIPITTYYLHQVMSLDRYARSDNSNQKYSSTCYLCYREIFKCHIVKRIAIFILDSELSDECGIDFTMLCVFFFFVCLCKRERVEIMLKFQTMGVASCSKMNLVGALGRPFFEFPNRFQKRLEKPKKN
ncbi:Uncharacterized protein FWK35_00013918 [Aphis craccivora]|uniref:Uncharacterized protein n=1 Tax=Aphis craccivora TaxID=307492 RepID=A0A6G0YRL1_APHCR|nr:Uncharacterized protein FWK35_00013918 [Aphis craccivora]